MINSNKKTVDTGLVSTFWGTDQVSNLTSNRIPYITTAGLFTDDADLTFDGTRLTASYASTTAISSTGSAYFATSGGNVGIATTSPWGLFSINPDALGAGVPSFVVGSSTATNFIITNSGNIGIGTTSPQATLGMSGSLGVNSSQLVLASNGNVNIGTTTTQVPGVNPTKLIIDVSDMTGSSEGLAIIKLNAPSSVTDDPGILFKDSTAGGGEQLLLDTGSDNNASSDGSYRFFFTDNVVCVGGCATASSLVYKKDVSVLSATTTEALYQQALDTPIVTYRLKEDEATSTLRLGLIAEWSPSEILTMEGEAVEPVKLGTMLLAGIQSQQRLFAPISQSTFVSDGATTTPRLVIGADGNVGIGVATSTSPIARLTVLGDAFGSSPIFAAQYVATSTGATTTALVIDRTGKVGIGTTTPEYKLHVIGSTRIEGSLTTSGDIAATSFVNISSRELKKDITYLEESEEQNILEKVKGMRVARYRYEFEDDSAPLRIGLIAEESPPEILSASGDGVDIYKLSTFTLSALQALQIDLEELAARVTAIENGANGGNETSGSNRENEDNLIFARLTAWLADAANGIGDLFAKVIHATKGFFDEVQTQKLCVGSVCVTEEQFLQMINQLDYAQPQPEEPTPTAEEISPPVEEFPTSEEPEVVEETSPQQEDNTNTGEFVEELPPAEDSPPLVEDPPAEELSPTEEPPMAEEPVPEESISLTL